jgi:hypothetical protein
MEFVLNSCEDGQKILAKVAGDDKVERKKALLRSYSLTYGNDICKAINQKRSSAQSAIYEAVMLRQTGENRGRVPLPGNFLKIIRRKGLSYKTLEGADGPTAENIAAVDSNRETFDWCADDLVPKLVSCANWGPNQKYYGHLSTYTHNGDEELCVPVNAEAFFMLILENCEIKWNYCVRQKLKKQQINKRAVKWNETKYSSSKAGHNQFGGWNDEGRVRFGELQEIIHK